LPYSLYFIDLFISSTAKSILTTESTEEITLSTAKSMIVIQPIHGTSTFLIKRMKKKRFSIKIEIENNSIYTLEVSKANLPHKYSPWM
jgi:hypothetical protein